MLTRYESVEENNAYRVVLLGWNRSFNRTCSRSEPADIGFAEGGETSCTRDSIKYIIKYSGGGTTTWMGIGHDNVQ